MGYGKVSKKQKAFPAKIIVQISNLQSGLTRQTTSQLAMNDQTGTSWLAP